VQYFSLDGKSEWRECDCPDFYYDHGEKRHAVSGASIHPNTKTCYRRCSSDACNIANTIHREASQAGDDGTVLPCAVSSRYYGLRRQQQPQ